VIAVLAARQHGVVSRVQLVRIGLTKHEIDDRVAAGRLQPLHRGVYAVGHREVIEADCRWHERRVVAELDGRRLARELRAILG
jgi:Transcriptional regulator, AbiEi antitoxin